MTDTINKPIYLSARDHENLRVRLSAFTDARSRRLTEKLRHEVERAVVLPAESVPADVVQIGSKVSLLDLDTNEREEYTLALPEHADANRGYLSVLAPLGTAIIGFGVTTEIAWEMPGGTRRLRIEHVTPPVIAAVPPQ
jgi:regulator of nucleoside diphosphate kinase